MTFAAPRAILAAAVVLGLAACQPITRNHGYVPSDAELAQVVVGQTQQAELRTLLGAPSSQGVLTNTSWFWVKSRFEQIGPSPSREIVREVVAVTFTDTGTVANVERFGLERGRIVQLSSRVTDPGVSALSALRQVLGNLGNIRAGQVLGD